MFTVFWSLWLHFCYLEISTLFLPSDILSQLFLLWREVSPRCLPGDLLVITQATITSAVKPLPTPSLPLHRISYPHGSHQPEIISLSALIQCFFPTSLTPPKHSSHYTVSSEIVFGPAVSNTWSVIWHKGGDWVNIWWVREWTDDWSWGPQDTKCGSIIFLSPLLLLPSLEVHFIPATKVNCRMAAVCILKPPREEKKKKKVRT